jgi:hypothetical protein
MLEVAPHIDVRRPKIKALASAGHGEAGPFAEAKD